MMQEGRNELSTSEFWENSYQNGDSHWDLGTPTPVFVDLLERKILPGPGSIIVLGCGRGHDAVLFGRSGFDVTAIDFSPTALVEAADLAKKSGSAVRFLEEDLFRLPETTASAFDYVLEYVTYCAIEPTRRREFLDVVDHALRPGGVFIALLFPADGRLGGPPFSVDVEEVRNHLTNRFELILEESPPSSVKPRRGKEVLMLWKKREIGPMTEGDTES